MVALSLLPVGLLQAWAAVEHGTWYARSAEFLNTDLMTSLKWMRAVGDTVFSVGVVALAAFVVNLIAGRSTRRARVRTMVDSPSLRPLASDAAAH